MFDIKEISTEVEDGAIIRAETSNTPPHRKLTEAKDQPKTNFELPRSSKSRKGGKAKTKALTKAGPPSQIIPQAVNHPITSLPVPADTSLSGQALSDPQKIAAAQPNTDCGQKTRATHPGAATVGDPIPDQGHPVADNQRVSALVGEITAIYRRYEDLRRARQRLELQAIATCRTVCGGDKVAGMKLYKAPTPEVELWLEPYSLAMVPLTAAVT